MIHAIPPKPDYFRVKVRRRLQRIGAAQLKNSVYVRPNDDESLEDFQWLARAIEDEGGEAMVCEASFVAGISDQEIQTLLNDEATGEVEEGEELESGEVLTNRVWVTREGIKVDRIASAWLIRRFIDPRARFKFVTAKGYKPGPDELRFDMYGGEYTHEGDRCSFETLLARFGLKEAALRHIGEIVHDVDCKDEKFARPEADGVASMVQGIAAGYPRDEDRLARGAAAMDDLYASFKR
ncbi:MAG TPA: chromate resistance protein ChrB domain-containing protein [Gemmatimonadales bacterium]|jgi:hypothetical protein